MKLAIGLGLLVVGCANHELLEMEPPDVPDEPVVEEPVPPELARAIEVARAAARYVSFDYSANGCFDRSTLIAAELASAGIPTNTQFIVAAEDEMLKPRQFPGLEWNFHVVPIVFFGPPTEGRKFLTIRNGEVVGELDGKAYVIDPALYPDEIAAPLATWIDDLTPENENGFLSVSDAREALDPPRDEAQAMERINGTIIPTTVAEMPKFWQFQLSSACSFLARDAGELESQLGAAAIEMIRRDMNTGVRALSFKMLDQDLLLEPEPVAENLCWDF
jgi:hypothetical protein